MSGATAGRPPWPGGAAWINGRYGPVEEAKISVLDLGVTGQARGSVGDLLEGLSKRSSASA